MARNRAKVGRGSMQRRIRAAGSPACQPLEQRRLLAVTASINGLGTLNVNVSASGDAVTLTADAATGNGFLVSGTGLAPTSFSNVTGIDVSNGNPAVSASATVNNQGTSPITLSRSIVFFGIASVNFSETQPVSLLSFVDSGSPLTLNVPSITTSGVQQFGAAVALAGNVTLTSTGGANITFSSTLNGAHALNVQTAGLTTFGGTVGANTRLGSITTGLIGSTSIGASIFTSSLQSYRNPVTLASNSTLTSATGPGSITFLRTLDGAFALSTNGGAEFDGAVGATTPLTSITINSPVAASFERSGITTTGAQSYSGPFEVGVGGPGPFVSTAGGNITFAGPLNGEGQPLTVDTAGITTFGASVSNVSTLMTDAPGSTHIGGSISTSGAQTFSDPVVLAANTTLTSNGADISLLSTIDGAFALSLNTPASIVLSGAVGSTTRLASLSTVAPGTVRVNAASFSTTGSQTYNGPIVLGANWTASSSGGGDIAFNNTVDGAFHLAASTGGNVAFGGIVGGAVPLINFTSSAGGATSITAARLTTQFSQVYGGAVRLGADCTLASSMMGACFLNGPLDGGFTLTVNAGECDLSGTVGAITPLTSLLSNASHTVFAGGSLTTTASQTYAGTFQILANGTLTSSGAGNITFASAVDASTTAFSLTVNTAGTTSFNGPVGASHPLATIRTDAPGTTVLGGGSVHTSNSQTYSDAVLLGLDTDLVAAPAGTIEFDGPLNGAHALGLHSVSSVLNGPIGGNTPLASLTVASLFISIGGGIITTGGTQTFSGPATLASDLVLSSTGSGPNDITFGGNVNGAHALTVLAGTGNVMFGGAVGGTTALTGLTVASANNVTAAAVTAGAIVQAAGLGTTTFSGPLHATAPAGISLSGNNFSLVAISVDHGSLTIAAGGAAAAGGTINAAGGLTKSGAGTLTLAQSNHYPGLTDVTAGTLHFNANQTLPGGIHIANGATAALDAATVLTTSFVAFDGPPGVPQGRLDVGTGQLLVTFGNTPDPIATIGADIAAGFNHGPWNGQGIFSSTAAANPSQFAVGYADGIDGVVQGLSPGNISVKLVVPGDVNLDGAVNFADLLALAQRFGQPNGIWDRGDLNYDGVVNFADLLTLAQHFGNTFAARATRLGIKIRAR